jgi:hypothetical protein
MTCHFVVPSHNSSRRLPGSHPTQLASPHLSLIKHRVHNDVRVIVRRQLARSSQPERRELVRARIEDLADSDRDIDTNIVTNQTSASNRFKSNESFSLLVPPYSPNPNLTSKDRSKLTKATTSPFRSGYRLRHPRPARRQFGRTS